MAKNNKQLYYIDLFAGCGGLSLGLHQAGWKGLFAIEKSIDAFKTLKHNLIDKKDHFNWPNWLPETPHDIDIVLDRYSIQLKKLRGKVDLVAGGPPCQGFSTAGLRKEGDVRNGLIRSYLRFIMLVRPRIIFFENVRGFTFQFKKNKSKGLAYSEYVLRVLKFMGYDVTGEMVNFSHFGIPQKRTRFILIGIRKENPAITNRQAADFFSLMNENMKSFLSGKKLTQHPSLADAISDLLHGNGTTFTPDRKSFSSGRYSKARSKYQRFLRTNQSIVSTPDSHSFAKHSENIKKRLQYIIKNKSANENLRDVLHKKFHIKKHTLILLSGESEAPTITTLPDDYIHYCEPRILTVREYARIQSFPDWYEFKGKYTTGGPFRTKEVPRYSQIGNAIPPLFGEQSGLVLSRLARNA